MSMGKADEGEKFFKKLIFVLEAGARRRGRRGRFTRHCLCVSIPSAEQSAET